MHEHRKDGAELLFLSAGPEIPNNPRLPVLLHRGAVSPGAPEAAEALFRAHGWRPAWRNGIYTWHHYHSNAHEALAIVAGEVRMMLGENAAKLYGFDLAALRPLAERAGITRELVATPLDEIPADSMCPTFQMARWEKMQAAKRVKR